MKDLLQEKLAEARRTQILNAASKVFARKGFHLTTIRDIAQEAGIADGTIYNYFDNKTALLFGLLDMMTQAVIQDAAIAELPQQDIRSFLVLLIGQPLRALRGNDFELFKVIVSEIMVNPTLREQYYQRMLAPAVTLAAQYFQELATQGVIVPVDADLLMRAISALTLGLVVEHVMGDQTVADSWDVLPEFIADLILNGIRRQG